jgi:hypothetical protein
LQIWWSQNSNIMNIVRVTQIYHFNTCINSMTLSTIKNKTLWQTQWHHFSKSQLFFISSYIPASPAYGVYISQLICYNRSCVQYSECLDRALLLTNQLPRQDYVTPRLKSSLQQLYDCNHHLIDCYSWRWCFLSTYNWQDY